MELFRKMFLDGDWQIAFRKKQNNKFDYNSSFFSVKNTKQYWFADPMIVSEGENIFLFCEAYDRKEEKGVIGYFELRNDVFSEFKVIISENYHLSYPCVFKYLNQYYMIPESSENNTLDLYKSNQFPDQWEKCGTLLKGERLVDSTVFRYNNKYYLYSYLDAPSYLARIYEFNIEKRELKLVKNINYDFNEGRGAGYVFKYKDKWIRPVQDCKEIYGKTVFFREVSLETDEQEKIVSKINAELVKIDHNVFADRIHTYSCNDDYEVIDFCKMKFNLFKRIKIIRRKIKTERRK